MQIVNVSVQSLEDAKNHKPVFAGINSIIDYHEGNITDFGILEGGMQSGKTSVVFKINVSGCKLPVIAEMSADMLRTLAAALKGAEEKFKI